MSRVNALFRETRPNFLVLAVILALLGWAAAAHHGSVNKFHVFLCMAGIVLLHVSTNVLNNYFDFKSGVDLKTRRTPFSGGSGVLLSGEIRPMDTLFLGLAAFVLAAPIGAYFAWTVDRNLLWLFLFGSVLVLFGTSHITRLGFGLGEIAAGLGLGALPVFGIAWILEGAPSWTLFIISAPSGFLVANLLLLNEFPDAEADAAGGRRTLPIQMGKRSAAFVYSAFAASAYLWIAGCVVSGLYPPLCLIALLTLPLSAKAVLGAFNHGKPEILLKGQAANVGVTLLTQGLLALGFAL